MQILPCIGNLYHRFKQNVPESESRQFDRLPTPTPGSLPRLRLRTPVFDPFRTSFLTCKSYGAKRTFSPRATRSLRTLPDLFLGTERCPHVLDTLCKFHPATRNGLGCTWGQWRPCREPGHRQTDRQTDAPFSNSKLDQISIITTQHSC